MRYELLRKQAHCVYKKAHWAFQHIIPPNYKFVSALLQKPIELSHTSKIEIDEFSIKKYIEKQYQEDVGQEQLARDLLKKVSP
jgi:hypothetical protein